MKNELGRQRTYNAVGDEIEDSDSVQLNAGRCVEQ